MNSAERFRLALRGEPVDRPPVLFTGGAWAGRLSGLPRERLLNDPEAVAAAQRIAHQRVGQEVILGYFDPLFLPEAYGCTLRFLDSGPITVPLPFDEIGRREPDLDAGRIPVVLDAIGRLAAYAGDDVPVGTLIEGPFTTLARLLDAEVLLRRTVRDPDAVQAALGSLTAFLLRFAQAAAEAGAEVLFVADPVASSTMISPRMYGRFALPAQQALVSALPIPVILHICGDTSPILEPMTESGAAALSLDQCMDMAAARRQVGRRCALAGNLDPLTLFLGKPEDVTRATRQLLEIGGREGYLLMPGCAVPPEAPLENVQAMVRAVKEA